MSSTDHDVYERVVDVHSLRVSKATLEEMFIMCGQVNNIFHWTGQQNKRHMLVEYASSDSAESARLLGLKTPDIQVIRVPKNPSLIRKFNEFSRSQDRTTPSRVHREPRPRSRPRSPSSTRSRPRSLPPREPMTRRRAVSPSPTRESLPKTERQETVRTASSVVIPQSSLEKKDRSCSKNTKITDTRQTTRPSVKESAPSVANQEQTKQMGIPKTASLIRIPYAGEYIEMDLNDQLEHDPTGIITILTAVEASQQHWMVVAAHYQSKNNPQSAKQVLKAALDLSIRLGRTDVRPFWYLLDQINNTTPDPKESHSPSIPVQKIVPPTKQTRKSMSLDPVFEPIKEIPSKPSVATQPPSSNQPKMSANTLSEIQRQINHLQNENKTLHSKCSDLLDDLAEARAGKRRAEDEIKEARVIRRRLERDLKEADDALRRSIRIEKTALEQIKTEVENRRRAEAVLDSMKAQQLQTSTDSQQNILLQLTSFIQKLSRSEHSNAQLAATAPNLITE